MKTLKLFVLICCCFSSVNLFAQTPKAIEADLLKSFKKIGYWDEKRANDKTFNSGFEDSLDNANSNFGKRLKYYAEKFPFTINQKFSSLMADYLNIATSKDSLFKVYSWDTEGGGTMREFENVFQYKWGRQTYAIVDTPKTDGDVRPNYNKVFTFKTKNCTYYLVVYLFIESSRYYGEGIQCFSISQGKLNNNIKIIKTQTGLHNQLDYEADLSSDIDWKVKPSIYFDVATQTIHIPLVEAKGKVTHRYITYKFTGKYFEKVKS